MHVCGIAACYAMEGRKQSGYFIPIMFNNTLPVRSRQGQAIQENAERAEIESAVKSQWIR